MSLTQESVGPGELLGLAGKAMGAGEYDDAVTHLTTAAREFAAAGDNRAAAMTCVRVGEVFTHLLGNRVAGHPWSVQSRLNGSAPNRTPSG